MAPRTDFRDGAAGLVAAARPAVENVLVHQRIDSTHACALRIIEQAETEEIILPTTLIVAGEQEQGQGRAGRSWASPPGGLYLSWLSAGVDPETVARMPIIAAAATHEAVSRLGIEGIEIKWPNDLMVDGRKLAGLLIHARHGATTWVVVSLGVNLEQAPTITGGNAAPTTSVAEHIDKGRTTEWAEAIIRVLVEEIVGGIADPDTSLATWKARLIHQPGAEITIRIGDGSEIRGRFIGLTAAGHLRLDCDGDERTIAAGDVIE